MRRTAWIIATCWAVFDISLGVAHAAPARLTWPQAVHAINHWGGPGTTLTKCQRFSRTIIGCEFLVPTLTAPEQAEENAEWDGSYFRGYLNVTLARHGIEVTCPPSP